MTSAARPDLLREPPGGDEQREVASLLGRDAVRRVEARGDRVAGRRAPPPAVGRATAPLDDARRPSGGQAAAARSSPASSPTATTSARSATHADPERTVHPSEADGRGRWPSDRPPSASGDARARCGPTRRAIHGRARQHGEREEARPARRRLARVSDPPAGDPVARDGRGGTGRVPAAATSPARARPGLGWAVSATSTRTVPASAGRGDDAHPVDASPTGPVARDVDDDPQRLPQLGVDGRAWHPRQRAERLDARGDLLGAVGVQRAHPALVPGVEGGEQLADLRSAHLPDDEPVGAHPQGLADEVDEGTPHPRPRRSASALQPHDVRVARVELAHVLDDDEAFLGGGTRRGARPAPSSCRRPCRP